MHSAKSEALIKSVPTILGQLKQTNEEITAQIQINVNTIEQHTKDIEQLHKDNEALAAQKTRNETFISKVEDILTSQ
jgi:septal ring factor EnvC (AmiA/AmiB activator)